MASSTQRASASQWKHDVFLSFRGEDTGRGFISHLYPKLQNRGIKTFKDDQALEIGMDISPSLLTAIGESRSAIVVLSPNYASSTWCLDELKKILQCSEANNTTVVPIFHDVDPSNVRNQRGSFAEAFTKHEVEFRHSVEDMEKVKQWRAALTKVANLSGFDSNKYGSERELVQCIVEFVCSNVRPISIMSSGDFVAVGASLSATAGNNCSWLSPSGDFAFGFRQLENNDLFLLSIWFAKIPDRTIVWYANGDRPAPKGSIVKLTADSGLVLTSPQGEQLWKSNLTIAGVVAHGVMNDTGNFVLEDDESEILWETFKNPTDTMLPGQIIERGGKLYSRQSETNYARGRFQLDFQQDGNLVFSDKKPFYSTKTTTGTVPGSEGKQLVFNDSGNFYILRVNGGRFTFTAQERPARDYYLRSTLNFDGVLAQYFLPKSFVGNVSWKPLWSEPNSIKSCFLL